MDINQAYDIVKDLETHDEWKKRMILVLSETKKNITVENFEEPEILPLLSGLGIFYRIVKIPGFKKLIMGKKKKEVKELYDFDEIIFRGKPSGKDHLSYGRLLSYPECCCFPNLKLENKKNMLGFHYLKHNPWKWDTNAFNGLIFHIPCSPDCQNTKRFAKKHLDIINMLTKTENIIHHKGSVLHFSQNLHLFFQADEEGSEIIAKDIKRKFTDCHAENSKLDVDFSKQLNFINEIKVGDKISVDERFVVVKKSNKTLTYKKQDISDGCLINFL